MEELVDGEIKPYKFSWVNEDNVRLLPRSGCCWPSSSMAVKGYVVVAKGTNEVLALGIFDDWMTRYCWGHERKSGTQKDEGDDKERWPGLVLSRTRCSHALTRLAPRRAGRARAGPSFRRDFQFHPRRRARPQSCLPTHNTLSFRPHLHTSTRPPRASTPARTHLLIPPPDVSLPSDPLAPFPPPASTPCACSPLTMTPDQVADYLAKQAALEHGRQRTHPRGGASP